VGVVEDLDRLKGSSFALDQPRLPSGDQWRRHRISADWGAWIL